MTTWTATVLLRPRIEARYCDGTPVRAADMATKVTVSTNDLAEADDAAFLVEGACALQWPGCDLVRVVRCVPSGRGGEVTPV